MQKSATKSDTAGHCLWLTWLSVLCFFAYQGTYSALLAEALSLVGSLGIELCLGWLLFLECVYKLMLLESLPVIV